MIMVTIGNCLRRSAVIVIAVPTLAFAASGPKKLPVCDGKHLRDVNIYGSVLPGSPLPGVVAPPAPPPTPQIRQPDGPSAPPPPVPSASGEKTSARVEPSKFGSC